MCEYMYLCASVCECVCEHVSMYVCVLSICQLVTPTRGLKRFEG